MSLEFPSLAGLGWAAELSSLLVRSTEHSAAASSSLEDSHLVVSERILSNSQASTSGSEAAAQQVQRLMQTGKHTEALR